MEDFRKFADEGNGVLLITHDIELALEVADRIVVFYAGKTVEEAPVSDFRSEETLRHPYTKALWRALPQNGFTPLDGTQPYVKDMPQGCPFGPKVQLVSGRMQRGNTYGGGWMRKRQVYPVLYVKRKYTYRRHYYIGKSAVVCLWHSHSCRQHS